ncbi:MAG: polyhydroxyalkanoate synthesis repressor PhaR [Alphaproteobacteria bacterium]|nr:polyhydroxyalkanoate synthesis repressor PhaR [Alphaproteobacteria bacterium]
MAEQSKPSKFEGKPQGADGDQPVIIKKYANRRLYNTSTSSYVTLDHLCQMVKEGTDFMVYDAKSKEDITHSVLTQIIVEEESKGHNLLPISFLRQIITLYGDNLQWLVPRYLEQSMAQFSHNQEQMRSYMEQSFGKLFPFGGQQQFEEMSRNNIAMFENAMKMFNPFGGDAPDAGAKPNGPAAPGMAPPPGADQGATRGATRGATQGPATAADDINVLKQQVDLLKRQIDQIQEADKANKSD